MKQRMKLSAVAVVCLSLSACYSTSDHQHQADVINANETANAQTFGLGSEQTITTDSMNLFAEVQQDPNLTVYFGFDRYNLEPEYDNVIQHNADYLLSHPQAKVRIEGYADEVGSREYNIALGQRRADTVEKAFIKQGVSLVQLTTVSYGMEYPVVECADLHNQRCQLNRRAAIVFTNKG